MVLPAGSPPRFLSSAELPRGPALWDPEKTAWSEANTHGLWVCDFASATMRLTKGPRRGELVQLRHWQGDLICDALRLDEDGRRAYGNYEVWISRKNSKSLIGAIFGLDGLFDEPGAEVYSCAGDRDQAKLIFSEVKAAVEMSPDLSKVLNVYRDVIEFPQFGSIYKALSSESRLQEGLNPSRVLFDELHAQRDDELWNVMNQGSDTRQHPLILVFTTKGKRVYSDGSPSIAHRRWEYVHKVMSGELDDPMVGARVYETTGHDREGFDYRDEKAWPESNPALGDFLHLRLMRSRARAQPQADFMAKRLNIWVVDGKTYLPAGAFEKLKNPRRRGVKGEDAILFLDGSYNQDGTAVIGWLLGRKKPHLTLLGLWEKPDDAAPDWHVPVAEVEKLLIDTVRGKPLDDNDPDGDRHDPQWQVKAVAFDPSRWVRTMMVLADAGLPVESIPNSLERMVPFTQAFYDAVLGGDFTHDGDKRLIRHVGNLVTKMTSKGTTVWKRGAAAKTDAGVAAVAGWGVVLAVREEESAPAASAKPEKPADNGELWRPQGRLKL